MQSIEDEIPDLSGPVSLGTYKFTRRGRGKKYETHKLSELHEAQEKGDENNVTEPTPSSSAHPPFNPPPPIILSSLQLSQCPTHQIEAELNHKILNPSDNPGTDRRDFHEPGPPQYDEFDPSHHAGNISGPIRSIETDRRSSQASGRAKSSLPPAQDHRSSPGSSVLINPATGSSQISEQVHPSNSPDDHNSNQRFRTTINPSKQSSQPASEQADNSFPFHDHSSNQHLNASINIDRRSSQASTPASTQAHSSFPPPDHQLGTAQQDSKLATGLTALIETDRRSSKVSGQANLPFPRQTIERHTFEPYRGTESGAKDILAAQRQSEQASSQAHRLASPKGYHSPSSLPLSDTLLTATYNLETNQWDPDPPEAIMPARTPKNRPASAGHSGPQSSRQSSSHGQQVRNPHAIITTTKSGHPYTNPYMPIDPSPPTAHQPVRESTSGVINVDNQCDDQDIVQHQRNLRYIDQEEARYRVLEQAKRGHAEGFLDDPFQDQSTYSQRYGRNQPSNYVEYAEQQAAYGQLPEYGHQPTFTSFASDPSASSFFSNVPTTAHPSIAGISPYRGQRSAYDQQAVIGQRTQNLEVAPHEQRPVYEQHTALNPRASVRLPAVKGTTDQQKVFLQEPRLENLSLTDSTNKSTQDQPRRYAQGGIQPATGRLSHAVPIRDPAAYTGSGLTTRRNQEALRQNLDTAVASSQGPAGSARTVMNDPHRDHQPSDRPSSTVTDNTVTGSTLRAQALSYESATSRRPVTTNPAFMKSRPGTGRPQERAALEESEALFSHYNAGSTLKNPERVAAHSEITEPRKSVRAPTIPPGFVQDTAVYTKNAGLPNAAIGAGNAFMNELVMGASPRTRPQQHLEDAATWFRTDPRDLSYAAALLPHETMNRMNAEQFPLEDTAPRTVSQLADDSQDDEPGDRARQAATPRPIGHGRPAGFTTPPRNHGPKQAATQAPFSTLAGVGSINDTEGMARSGRKFLEDDARAIEAMFGGVYSNLMAAKNGPYDYMNHYCPPPAHAIDHNAKNDNTLFDPQWFATAPPARVGRDPRRERGEYEDPTQGSAGRSGDHTRVEAIRRDSGGRGGGGGHAWGRI